MIVNSVKKVILVRKLRTEKVQNTELLQLYDNCVQI